MKKVFLSAIITAHHEGLLAHKTMLSIFEALEQLDKSKYKYEIIVHLDNPDSETENYFKRYNGEDKIRMYTNHFGDLGMSRNFAVEKAKGDLVGVIDADDLTSPNWFSIAAEMANNSKDLIIVHPEYNFTFGVGLSHHVLWTQVDARNDNIDKIIMAGVNPWASMCLAKKEVFLSFPYAKAGKGFGNEDWFFNTETMAAGIKHYVAKNVTQFYRRKEDSLLTANLGNRLVQWPTKYLDLMEYKKIPLTTKEVKTETNYRQSVKRIAKKGARVAYGSLLRTPLKYALLPLSKKVKKIIGYKSNEKSARKIPKCVIEEWKKINHIETQLYPTDWRMKSVEFYTNADKVLVGEALRLIVEPMTAMPDFVFIVPWIIPGGADKVLLNYIEALKEKHPEWTVAVITTLPSANGWKDKLPDNAYLLDFGNITKLLNSQERECVFNRLIVELRCRKVHIINSQYGYDYVMRHKDLFACNFDVTVSIFNFEYIPGSDMMGVYDYADPSLVEIFPVVKKVYTDNKTIIKRDVERNGFDAKKFTVHYQPYTGELKSCNLRNNKTMKVLWAGRICNQKNPEIVLDIMKKLDSERISVDMYGKMEDDYNAEKFSGTKGLKYKGEFNGLSSISIDDYDVYLYTSTSDGLPNVLLEAAAAGIPIIAPNVGGIGEFIINEKTGILIDKFDDVEAFTEAIKFANKNPETMQEYAKNAQSLLKKQHSWKSFVKDVERDFGYKK